MAPKLKPEKHKQAVDYLSDPLFASNTNKAIAELVGCHPGSIARIRNRIRSNGDMSSPRTIERIDLSRVVLDPEIQPRVSIDEEVVEQYVEAWKDKTSFPPIVVFQIGDEFLVADGFHRTISAKKAKQKTILADIRQGDREDAIIYAAGANAEHGKQRSADDKIRAILLLSGLNKTQGWSQGKIAQHIKVSQQYVSKVLAERATHNLGCELPKQTVGKDGKVRDTTNIGRKKDSESFNGHPQAPQGTSSETPAEPDDSMASNPDDGGDPSFVPEQIDAQAEASAPTQPERKPAEVKVEEVKHDPPAEPAKADPEAAFLESCSLYRGLTRKEWKRTGKTPLEWFVQSARRYFRGRERKKAYFDFHKANLCGGKDAGNCLDPLASEDLWWLKISHPRDWHDCLGDETGHCHRDCRTCKGFGFLISRED